MHTFKRELIENLHSKLALLRKYRMLKNSNYKSHFKSDADKHTAMLPTLTAIEISVQIQAKVTLFT